jgi:hypothetical protein
LVAPLTPVTLNDWPLSFGPGESLAVRSPAAKVRDWSSGVVLESSLARGASLTGLTLMVTVFWALVLGASQLESAAPQLSGSPRSVTV